MILKPKLKVSTGFSFDKSAIAFEYKSPLNWQQDNLVFGLQTQSSDCVIFRAYNLRTNKSIQIELVNGFIQAKLTDNNGMNNLHVFDKFSVNDNKYHEIKFTVFESNSSLSVDNKLAKRETFIEKRKCFRKYFISLKTAL